MKVLVFGAGFSGRRLGETKPASHTVFGTTRDARKLDALRKAHMEPLLFADRLIDGELRDALRQTTHLVISIAPDAAGDPVLDAMAAGAVEMPNLQWIGYLSTVGVYGDYQGGWVDEDSPCKPLGERSRWRLEAEDEWLSFGARHDIPVAVLRLSGIYGPGRNAFANLQNGTARRINKPGQVFNRIHVDDIAGALWHLMAHNTGGVFNVTDDMPSPPQDVVTYAAEMMGIVPPDEIPFDAAQFSPMARSFYEECKRVSNARLKSTGYVFHYPDYHAAMDAMWREGNWQGK